MSDGGSATFRIATWNMSHAVKHNTDRQAEAWTYLLDDVHPDVALVQEAGVPFGGIDGSVAAPTDRTWTTGVVAYGTLLEPFTAAIIPSWSGAPEFRVPDIARAGCLGPHPAHGLEVPEACCPWWGSQHPYPFEQRTRASSRQADPGTDRGDWAAEPSPNCAGPRGLDPRGSGVATELSMRWF